MTTELPPRTPTSSEVSLIHMIDQLSHVRPADVLLPNRQLRQSDARLVQKWKKSIEEHGFVVPLVLDDQNLLVHGEEALAAAVLLGMPQVPVVRVGHLDHVQKRALRLALERLGELPTWDNVALADELSDLIDLGVDITDTAFEVAEADIIISENLIATRDDAIDDIPPVPTGDPISRLGDVWRCGDHLVACGDARNVNLIKRLASGRPVRMVITDPPYGVPIKGFVSGNGKAVHDDFVMGAGEMSDDEFAEFLVDFLTASASSLVDGGLLYSFIDWRHVAELIGAGTSQGLELLNLCVWNKSNAGMGSFYRSKHELIAVFKSGTAPYTNNIELGRHGRNRTNVWDCDGANSFNKNLREELANHPTPKPVALIADAIRDASAPSEFILDPFLGGGTTMVACEETKRRCIGIELDPKFVDVSLSRWQKLSGLDAVHVLSGLTFSEIAKRRSEGPAGGAASLGAGSGADV